MRKIFCILLTAGLAFSGYSGETAASFTIKGLLNFSSRFTAGIGVQAPEAAQVLTVLTTMVMMMPQMAEIDPARPCSLVISTEKPDKLEVMFAVFSKGQTAPGLVDFGREKLLPFRKGQNRYLLAKNQAAASAVPDFFIPVPAEKDADLMIRAVNDPAYSRIISAAAGVFLEESARRCGGIWGLLLSTAVSEGMSAVVGSADRLSWDLWLPNRKHGCAGDMTLRLRPGSLGSRYMAALPPAGRENLSAIGSPEYICTGSIAVTEEFLAKYRNFLNVLAGRTADVRERELILSFSPLLSDLTGVFCISSYPGEGTLLTAGVKKLPVRFAGKSVTPGTPVQLENRTWLLARNRELLILSARTQDPDRIRTILSAAKPPASLAATTGTDLISGFDCPDGKPRKVFGMKRTEPDVLKVRTMVPEKLFIQALMPAEKELIQIR